MTQPTKSRRDRRPFALALTAIGVLAGGLLIANYETIVDATRALRMRGHVEMQRRTELDARFEQGVVMLHSRQFDYAAQAFHRVLELAPRLPEAHVNMGFALVGLEQWRAAHDFFVSAVELRPEQANAYYGLAVALEGMGDIAGALGAMRTFVHRAKPDDRYLIKAQSAIWEWEESIRLSKEQASKDATPEATPAGPVPSPK